MLQESEGQEATPSSNGAAAPSPAPAAPTPSLPLGWFEAVDPTYNHPYWSVTLSTAHRKLCCGCYFMISPPLALELLL